MLLGTLCIAAAITGGIIYAADHIDSPNVTGKTTDITDLYIFRGENTNNLVFTPNPFPILSEQQHGKTGRD